MNLLDTENTFLEALEYPHFAIPEFWIKKQIESGWSKKTYLNLLHYQHNQHNIKLRLLYEKYIKEAPETDQKAVGYPLDELTNGKIKEAYTLSHQPTKVLNRDLLATLLFCINKAYDFDEPTTAFTDLQIISFARQSLYWIIKELKSQSDNSNIYNLRNFETLKSFTGEGQKIFLLHSYSLMLPSPVFDFYLFEDALRNLLLNITNLKSLEAITKPMFELGKQAVNLWNEKLHELDLDFDSKRENVKRTRRLIEFDTKTRWFNDWVDTKTFVQSKNQKFSNYDLVLFASRVGDIVATEVLGIEETAKPVKVNPQFLNEIFLNHSDYIKSIAALRQLDVIDNENNNIIGPKLKGVMQVWVNILRNERNYLKQVSDDILTVLLNKQFQGLNLGEKTDGKHFRNHTNKTANSKYRSKLLALIRE